MPLKLFSILLLFPSSFLPAATPTSPSPAEIPSVHADTLAGAHVRLPEDLRGKSGILVLGFSKDSRAEVRDWGKRLADDFFSSPNVLYYEMPVVAGVPRLMRGLVLRSIAAEVSERGKQHFVPISDNEARWRSLVQYKDPNSAYLLVVDSSGRPQWTTSGALTEAAYSDLLKHLSTTSK